MRRTSIFVFFFLVSFTIMEEHAIYISTTYLTIQNDHARAEIRVFEDDLRASLQNFTGYLTDTTSVEFHQDCQLYFRKYFTTHVTSHQILWTLDDAKLVGDSYRLFFSAPTEKDWDHETWKIKAVYFFELFATQKNILKVTIQDEQYFEVFDDPDHIYHLDK